MSAETSNDSFIANMLATIKEIQAELNELKIIKRGIVKKSTKRKAARRTVKRKAARRTVKRKAARRTVKRKAARRTVKRKAARRGTKAKRKTNRRRQVPGKPSYLTNLCPNQCENS